MYLNVSVYKDPCTLSVSMKKNLHFGYLLRNDLYENINYVSE